VNFSLTQSSRPSLRTLLVTGHTGFVGRTVREVLRTPRVRPSWRFAALPNNFDIRSPELAREVVKLQPDAVLHLAGLTSVAESFRSPEEFFDVNFNGTWNLLKALRSAAFDGRLLFVSSGDCYGDVAAAELPVAETRPLRPLSPYAVSKAAAESLCYQWARTNELDVVMTRSFNHLGPGQDARFAIPSFAKQVVAIRRGLNQPRIVTGNLDVTRDLTDVRDVVLAYLALLDKGAAAEVYNVGSGRETRLRDVLDQLIRLAGIEAEIVTDSARTRAGEQLRAMADVRKIEADTGWSASIPLSETLMDVLNDWEQRTERE
jgi:GDP-4-dehydro-6-deoxy-D-mannose reductase